MRIFNRKTNERSLLKAFNGRLVDLSFAYSDEVLLGCVDETGTGWVFKISVDSENKIQTELVFCVEPSEKQAAADTHRFVWCNYIPDPNGESDPQALSYEKLFLITNRNKLDLYNLQLILEKLKPKMKFKSNEFKFGHAECVREEIIDSVCFSPDATALAMTSNGSVSFWKIDDYSLSQADDFKLLQSWHIDTRPIKSIFFLDNLKHVYCSQFWVFMMTINDQNEIRVWSCVDWAERPW